MDVPQITIIGAGLAGSEAAYQASRLGVKVRLYEMKPVRKSPAHHSDGFAELVCSNSLRSNQLENGVGLLKEELRILGSLIMQSADKSQVPAGGALAVDREEFSGFITKTILEDPNIEVIYDEIHSIPDDGIVVIATGPLTESIDRTICFAMSRYGKGGDDYLNCPMNEEEYRRFYEALTTAELADVKGFDKENLSVEITDDDIKMIPRNNISMVRLEFEP